MATLCWNSLLLPFCIATWNLRWWYLHQFLCYQGLFWPFWDFVFPYAFNDCSFKFLRRIVLEFWWGLRWVYRQKHSQNGNPKDPQAWSDVFLHCFPYTVFHLLDWSHPRILWRLLYKILFPCFLSQYACHLDVGRLQICCVIIL